MYVCVYIYAESSLWESRGNVVLNDAVSVARILRRQWQMSEKHEYGTRTDVL